MGTTGCGLRATGYGLRIRRFAGVALVATLCTVNVVAQDRPPQSGSGSPAERRIAAAERAIAANPTLAQPYNDLALALSRRARETGDPSYYDRADQALASALAIDAGNVEARKLGVWNLLGRHEFEHAREAAGVLNRQAPDDVLVYGFVADANAELGNYQDAEDAVQWMLDMRPNNLSGLTRAAYLRELFGDVDGALELFMQAFDRMAPTEVEDRAWILSQIGHLLAGSGRTSDAETVLQQALAIFPDYHYALGYLAQVRTAQKRYTDAVVLLRRLCASLPHAENLYALAEALELSGNSEATAVFAEFEQKALAESSRRDNANRELVAYYADHAGRPADAQRIAEIEHRHRRDVYTLDAYAWALYRNGRTEEARASIDAALQVGIRNAEIDYHAGAIAAKQGDRVSARKYFERSLALSPDSRVADEVRKALR
jgi:tetratricopeptide (TPR) repeat protein